MTARLHRGLEVVARADQEDLVARVAAGLSSPGVEVREGNGRGVRYRVHLPAGGAASAERRFGELWRAYTGEPAPEAAPFAEAERDWGAEARGRFAGTRVGPFWIGPPWCRPPEGVCVVRINPGRAFGTGLHPSTRIALLLLPNPLSRRLRVLDLGTGSGVLALACLALGAEGATALDVDLHALDNAGENAHLNAVHGRLRLVAGSAEILAPAARFDLILANLERPLLEPLLQELVRLLAVGGRIVASGVLLRDRAAFLDAAGRWGLEALHELDEEEWWGAALAAS